MWWCFDIHWHESVMGAHVSPHLELPSNPPIPILLGCPRAPALSALLHASNLHWSSVLHMIIYMFQCYSLKSSHPRFLPHRPKVCSLYLCLFCCLAYRVVVVAAAAAAKSLQSCLTLCDPTDGSPPGSPIPGILQTRTLEWVAISFSKAGKWKVKVKSLNSVWLLATPWTAAYQAPLSMGFSRQKSTGVGCHCLLWGLLLASLS